MPRKPYLDPSRSPEAFDYLAASYRSIAETMVGLHSRERMLKMAERFDALARQMRAELEGNA